MKEMKQMHWERCPSCGSLGRIDHEQYKGLVSIECSGCGKHYRRDEDWKHWRGMAC